LEFFQLAEIHLVGGHGVDVLFRPTPASSRATADTMM
jgi:hypothetical protein